ncbi:MAG: alpha/beta hydrolase [Ruminococcus sp.]|nr:alpha/beta hydrolase [Ruminococcus sp.]
MEKQSTIQMDYFSFGSGAKTMVILPGLGTRSILFSEMMIRAAYRQFERDYTVYVFDRRTDLPPVYTIREMARDTAAKMRELGLRDADVFGASLGGMVAQYLAADAPELVHAMALGSTAPYTNTLFAAVAKEWTDAAENGDLTALTAAMISRLFSEATVRQYGDVLTHMNDGLTGKELRRFAIQGRAASGFDAREALQRVHCPTLVIGVKGDKVLTGEASEELAALLRCRLYLYPDTYGHCVFDEAKDYKDRLMQFFISTR